MAGTLFTVLGGVGMFLMGMKLMTDALREAAGPGIRRLLSRFTRTPLAGVLTGAAVTTLLQSSSAVSVMTVGFVGAGMIGFAQSLGVLYGANIGTTSIGWLVTLLAFDGRAGAVAQPALFAGAMLALTGRGGAARLGRGIAGAALVFVGLDLMQAAAAAGDGMLDPADLPQAGWGGRVLLVSAGIVVTVVIQSSGAGLALVLVMVGAGSIDFMQAVALVIGMNIGTTFTSLVAAVGGAPVMRRTALANVVFNASNGLAVLPFIGFIAPALAWFGTGDDPQVAVALFHSMFNVLGTLVFLPVTGAFGRLLTRLVPDADEALTAGLDPALLEDPSAAMDAAGGALDAVAGRAFATLAAALAAGSGGGAILRAAALPERLGPALGRIEDFLARVQVPPDLSPAITRNAALLHQFDHVLRLVTRAGDAEHAEVLGPIPALARPGRALGAALGRAAADGDAGARQAARLARLADLFARRMERHRHARFSHLHDGFGGALRDGDLDLALAETDSMRWLARLSIHAARIAAYRAGSAGASGGDAPTKARRGRQEIADAK